MILVRNDNCTGVGEMLGPMRINIIVGSKLSKRKLYSHSDHRTKWEFQVHILKENKIKRKLTKTLVFPCSVAVLIHLLQVIIMD